MEWLKCNECLQVEYIRENIPSPTPLRSYHFIESSCYQQHCERGIWGMVIWGSPWNDHLCLFLWGILL
jgi:hypothetical protein